MKVALPENRSTNDPKLETVTSVAPTPEEKPINVHNIPPFALKNKKTLQGQELYMGNYSKEAQRVLLSGKGFY